MHIMGHIIVEVWECNPVFCANWLTDDNLVDIIKLIPVFIPIKKKAVAHNHFSPLKGTPVTSVQDCQILTQDLNP